MCGIKSRSLLALLGLLLLALPVFCWAKGSAEESNVELIERKPSGLITMSTEDWNQYKKDWNQMLSRIENLENLTVEQEKTIMLSNQKLKEQGKSQTGLVKEIEGLKEKTERQGKLLNKTVPIVVGITVPVFMVASGIIGGLINSALPEK